MAGEDLSPTPEELFNRITAARRAYRRTEFDIHDEYSPTSGNKYWDILLQSGEEHGLDYIPAIRPFMQAVKEGDIEFCLEMAGTTIEEIRQEMTIVEDDPEWVLMHELQISAVESFVAHFGPQADVPPEFP